ncbi:MAG: hypothetical protein IJM67_05095 [Atopobiaceae bacterium]|nr:hypothetical protein [Atopobiaceae bacterium]
MRTSDEQLDEVLRRSARLKARVAMRHAILIDSLAAAACLVLLVFVATTLPDLGGSVVTPTGGQYGSLVLDGPNLGHVVICLLAFLLGVFLTLLSIHLRKIRGK